MSEIALYDVLIKMGADPEEAKEAVFNVANSKEMATKSDIKDMATKSDIKDMATKSDIKDMATKTDLAKQETRIVKEIYIAVNNGVRLVLGGVALIAAVVGLAVRFL